MKLYANIVLAQNSMKQILLTTRKMTPSPNVPDAAYTGHCNGQPLHSFIPWISIVNTSPIEYWTAKKYQEEALKRTWGAPNKDPCGQVQEGALEASSKLYMESPISLSNRLNSQLSTSPAEDRQPRVPESLCTDERRLSSSQHHIGMRSAFVSGLISGLKQKS